MIFPVVIVALLPFWPYSHNWGYAPSVWAGLLGLVMLVLRLLRAI